MDASNMTAPDPNPPFWKTTPLNRMTPEQWESLCDGCGRCCLEKLQNPRTGKVYYTGVACPLLDLVSCRCTDYENRHRQMPDCLTMTPETVVRFRWLPKTCAYRLISEGNDLPEWHPLISGDRRSVHRAGISVRGKAISGAHVHPDDLSRHIVDRRLIDQG